jgi:hypothetical protein
MFFSGCEKRISRPAGFLEGTISIGPVCPVERDPQHPGCLPDAETYKAYPVRIWTNGRVKIAEINPALDGSFITELPPGNYLVILEKNQGGIGSSNLPVEVSINSLGKTILNIDIDIGIR